MARFYTFSQNNSGGSFDRDELAGIGDYVVIEAETAAEANDRAVTIGLYFNGCDSGMDCECCGDRWYPVSEHDANVAPEIYGNSALTYGDSAYVHYLDGRVVRGEE